MHILVHCLIPQMNTLCDSTLMDCRRLFLFHSSPCWHWQQSHVLLICIRLLLINLPCFYSLVPNKIHLSRMNDEIQGVVTLGKMISPFNVYEIFYEISPSVITPIKVSLGLELCKKGCSFPNIHNKDIPHITLAMHILGWSIWSFTKVHTASCTTEHSKRHRPYGC